MCHAQYWSAKTSKGENWLKEEKLLPEMNGKETMQKKQTNKNV